MVTLILHRQKIKVDGRVQGVGFRPFVFSLAKKYKISGFVGNNPEGVFIEAESSKENLNAFVDEIKNKYPPLAEVVSVDIREIPVIGENDFIIVKSSGKGVQNTDISPDASICPDCLAELQNPKDRRYGYPFINCTNCGPRYSITKDIPYDRTSTTMADFKMCDNCQAEYDNPLDRRFHAQPNACHVCGPRIWLSDSNGEEVSGDTIKKATEWLKTGKTLAVKGLGGFHLVCNAFDDNAVQTLRARKKRRKKPFAIMALDINEARKLCYIEDNSEAEKQLLSWRRPIIISPLKENSGLSKFVSPATDNVGIMLPYTPLHYLIMEEMGGALVMTSANPSDEPLCSENDEALKRLSSMTDGFLFHNRNIYRRIDDSVAVSIDSKTVIPLRRSRGYVPEPLKLPVVIKKPLIAVGGEMKSTVCLLSNRGLVVSEHLGELSNPESYRNFITTIEQFKKVQNVYPSVIACDMHPSYPSSLYAENIRKTAHENIDVIKVQHHHAHVVSCMTENGITGRVMGVALDGTGYGTDGNIWGGELLKADEKYFKRVAHLSSFPLVGGDVSAKETWRSAMGIFYAMYGDKWQEKSGHIFDNIDDIALKIISKRLSLGVLTSSMGRLIDGVAFIMGLCDKNTFEAESAMILESLAENAQKSEIYPYNIEEKENSPVEINFFPMIEKIIKDILNNTPRSQISLSFHRTIADMFAKVSLREAKKAGINRVVLSGGCLANRFLHKYLLEYLEPMECYTHKKYPCGDGGVSLGQAVIANSMIK